MSQSRVACTVIAMLLTISAIVMALTDGIPGIGIGLYVVVAIAVTKFSRAMPEAWPGCLFEVSKASRSSLVQRLLIQLAALVCLLSAQAMSGAVSTVLSVTGLLLFIHTLVLARLPQRARRHRGL
ncbi:hypothetical protein PS918_02775 [Pseudomonas fluorescens]|uniref:Uncharacterized protein n=1 Tax=Pseudomonas fluorescens TaxID=294 RepID=A0A5E7SGL3_PSEFL|nr:hypothetical protein [Pseudomonas fluorescens]VVP85921.1 hypothetical protein PS918_02775 [Pseudomonas fluorescens]